MKELVESITGRIENGSNTSFTKVEKKIAKKVYKKRINQWESFFDKVNTYIYINYTLNTFFLIKSMHIFFRLCSGKTLSQMKTTKNMMSTGRRHGILEGEHFFTTRPLMIKVKLKRIANLLWMSV